MKAVQAQDIVIPRIFLAVICSLLLCLYKALESVLDTFGFD